MLREYQARSVAGVRAHWGAGARSVCLVAPTGAGKTCMGEELIANEEPALWVAHRRDLVDQTAARLIDRFGYQNVGAVMAGARESLRSRVQVGTVHSLLARNKLVGVATIVLDECHHYVADDWKHIVDAYPTARVVGLTATPERADGTPLGDMFSALVVAANYSDLVADGHLVPVCMYRPARALGSDLAADPVAEWLRLSGGAQTFVFCPRIEIAKRVARSFRLVGISAAEIDETTPGVTRSDRLARFRRGALRVLTSVGTLTEGIDVPEAACAILMRNYVHVGPYVQATGRVLRASPGKRASIVFDLTGASHRLGLPTDDRDYALTGRAIGGVTSHDTGERAMFDPSIVGEPLEHVGVVLANEPIAPTGASARRYGTTVLAHREILEER